MGCGSENFQVQQRHQIRWLHRLALIAVTQATFAAFVYTNCDEYFNVTGMVSNNVIILMITLSVHLLILEAAAYISSATGSDYPDSRCPSDPDTSFCPGIRYPKAVPVATPAVSCQSNDDRCIASCYQLLQTSYRDHPTTSELKLVTTCRHSVPPSSTPLLTGCDVIQSVPTSTDVKLQLGFNKKAPLTSLSMTHFQGRVDDVINQPRFDVVTRISDDVIIISGEKTMSAKKEKLSSTDRKDCTTWLPHDNSSVTRTTERKKTLIRRGYVIADVIKAVCCISVLKPLLVYVYLYYWRLSTFNIISVFVSSFAVIFVEVNLTVIGFLL